MFLFFSLNNGFNCGKGLRFFLQLCLIIVRQETDKHATIKQRPSAKKKDQHMLEQVLGTLYFFIVGVEFTRTNLLEVP